MTTYLAVDLETVLDVELGKRALWAPGELIPGARGTLDDKWWRQAMRDKQREASGGKSDFLKPLFHQVVALGMAYYDPATGKSASGGHVADEPLLLARFMEALRKRPTLVTFNGRQFDLCVVRHRGLIHRLDCRNLYGSANAKSWELYEYRYGGPHLDLADVLTNYGACPMPKLNELALAMGYPPKLESGAEVEGMWERGEMGRLGAYVEEDARLTLKLALAFEVARHRLDAMPELFAEELFTEPAT